MEKGGGSLSTNFYSTGISTYLTLTPLHTFSPACERAIISIAPDVALSNLLNLTPQKHASSTPSQSKSTHKKNVAETLPVVNSSNNPTQPNQFI